MANGIPADGVGLFVGVLVYSIICGFLSSILVVMLWKYGERLSYISLLALFVSISTLASIIQQIHYGVAWKHIKEVEWAYSRENASSNYFILGGVGETTDKVLFGIQYYSYNVESLLVAFWASALFRSSWDINMALIRDYTSLIPTLSKIFAVTFPAIIVGLVNTPSISSNRVAFFIFCNAIMLISLTSGSVLLILVLWKYMHTRRLTVRHQERSAWWQPGSGSSMPSTTESTPGTLAARKSRVYDRALITRFTAGFVVLFVFSMCSIIFQWRASSSAHAALGATAPDLSRTRITSDLLTFIPGVTASLVTFLVFGTTRSARQYGRLFSRKKKVVGAEEGFERLPAPGPSPLSTSPGRAVGVGPRVAEARELELVERVQRFVPKGETPQSETSSQERGNAAYEEEASTYKRGWEQHYDIKAQAVGD